MLIHKLKQTLKRNPFLWSVNARFKAVLITRASARIARSYADQAHARGCVYSESVELEHLRRKLTQRGILISAVPRGKLRIFWAGANWNQDNSGFLAALHTFGDVTCLHNARGGYGWCYESADRVIFKYNADVVRSNDGCLIEQVKQACSIGKIQVLMGQMWANFVSTHALGQIQKMGIITVNVSMDDRLPEHWESYKGIRLGSVGLAGGLDLVLTSSSDCCVRYAVEGCPAIFWPMASDPERFKPFPEDQKRYDVSFIGGKYGQRGRIIRRLLHAGIKVEAFGPGWSNGPVNADQSAEIFGKSRIILGMGTIAYNKNIYTLKLRDFDATMTGALYITHRNPDLLALFEEGREIECYLTIDECVKKIRYYLDHPVERQSIAEAGMTRARRDHTWDLRLSTALQYMGLLD
jgi:hypothetical protein